MHHSKHFALPSSDVSTRHRIGELGPAQQTLSDPPSFLPVFTKAGERSRAGSGLPRPTRPAGSGGGAVGAGGCPPSSYIRKVTFRPDSLPDPSPDCRCGKFDCGPCGDRSLRAARRRRFKLSRTACRITPWCQRLARCGLVRVAPLVDVYQSTGNSQTMFRGVETCGSVWLCTRCAAKITERRRRQLNDLVDRFRQQAEHPGLYMLTLTAPHTGYMTLQECLDRMKNALEGFWSGRGIKALKLRYGWRGHVTCTEVTHSFLNGWHVHFHILIFVDHWESVHPQYDQRFRADLEAALYDRWSDKCLAANLDKPSRAHGCQLQDGTRAIEYVAKYGAEHLGWTETSEVAKSHVKVSKRKGHRTPWQVLGDIEDKGRLRDVAVWQEYARAFPGRHQLHVSRGFSAWLGVEEKSDSAVAADIKQSAVLIARLEKQQWALVTGCSTGEAQASEAIERGGIEALQAWIDRAGSGAAGRVLAPGELASVVLPAAIVAGVADRPVDFGVPASLVSWREFGYESANEFFDKRASLKRRHSFMFRRCGGDPPVWWFPSSPYVDPLPILRFAQAVAVVGWLSSHPSVRPPGARQLGDAGGRQLAFSIFDPQCLEAQCR